MWLSACPTRPTSEVGSAVHRGDAYGQGHLAPVQRQVGDLLGGGGHPVQRPEVADDQRSGTDEGTGRGQQREQRFQAEQLRQQTVHVAQRKPDHHHPVVAGLRHQPVAVEGAGEVHRMVGTVGRQGLQLGDQPVVLVVGQRQP